MLAFGLAIFRLPAAAQDGTFPGDSLENITISEEEARFLMKGLFDVTRLSHSLAVGRIANDERLLSFTDGFVQRNNIEVLTIGYIDSNQFWPRVFRESRLRKAERAPTDQLLTGMIIFVPQEVEGSINGYRVSLELNGKSQ